MVLGEWFKITFEEAVSFVRNLFEQVGDENFIPRDVEEFSFYNLPTAMEELEAEDPVIYKWLIEQGHEAYYDKESRLWVHTECGDMLFLLYATVASRRQK